MPSEISAPTAVAASAAPATASTPSSLLPARGNGAAAILALADGTVFRGVATGALGHSVGEVVFNTAMTGYQEILTDPSYAGQIVTLTYPHVGNVGVNDEDVESRKPFAAGLVIRDLPRTVSNFRSTGGPRRLSRGERCRRHRRHRHAQAHSHPARAGRAKRLPVRGGDDRRARSGGRRRPRPGGALDGGPRSRQGRELHDVVRVDVGRMVARGGIRNARQRPLSRRRLRFRRQAQHPAHSRGARVHASPSSRRRRRRRRCSRRSPTASSCRTARATPSPATMRSGRSANHRRDRTCRPSGSASATSSSGSRRAPRR